MTRKHRLITPGTINANWKTSHLQITKGLGHNLKSDYVVNSVIEFVAAGKQSVYRSKSTNKSIVTLMKPLALLFLAVPIPGRDTRRHRHQKRNLPSYFRKTMLISPEAKAKKLKSQSFDQKPTLKVRLVMGLSSSLPKGIEVSFSPETGNFEIRQSDH